MMNMEKNSSMSAKLKTKAAVRKIKHGSPKLQEVLRQRCRERMKEKRGQLFDRRRGLTMETDDEVHEALTEIVRSELSQLATMDIDGKNPLLLNDCNVVMTEEEAFAIESEILEEEEQWIFAEYERLKQDEAGVLALFAEDCLKEITICPLCEKGLITETRRDELICTLCDLRLPSKVGLNDFRQILNSVVASHSSHCQGRPCFMLLPENETIYLYLMCEICQAFALIV